MPDVMACGRSALAVVLAALLPAGCVEWGRAGHMDAARAPASAFQRISFETPGLPVRTLLRQRGPGHWLAIYIEGDGAAWASPYHPPRDPTPRRPLAFALAAADPSPLVAYLGRPCQYLDERERANCDSAYWLDRRFAPEVIATYDALISRLRARSGATRLRLVGYSGGGVIATLLAQRRDDVDQLITVAAPLALGEWTRQRRLSALVGSLDPAQARTRRALPWAWHFAGADDAVVPPAVVRAFVAQAGGRLEVVPGFDHECCWQVAWPRLLALALAEEAAR